MRGKQRNPCMSTVSQKMLCLWINRNENMIMNLCQPASINIRSDREVKHVKEVYRSPVVPNMMVKRKDANQKIIPKLKEETAQHITVIKKNQQATLQKQVL